MEVFTLRGKVTNGQGDGHKFVSFQWVKDQIAEKLGFVPYPGTLNLTVLENDPVVRRLRNSMGIKITPRSGSFPGKLFKATFQNVESGILIPQTPDYPSKTIEIVAPCSLRELLRLRDGDIVELKIQVS
jgi:riboflavin kinase